MGLVAGINASRILAGKNLASWPRETATGSLIHYLMATSPSHFQPMNINLGLFPELTNIKGKKERAKFHRDCAIESMKDFLSSL